MKLWQKNTSSSSLQKQVDEFTIGSDKHWDLLLAESDVIGSIAHATMLESIGLLSPSELKELKVELNNILKTIKEGKFSIEEGVEDVHSQIEFLLTKNLGETGKKIHSGRSRNDQSLLDIKLYLRKELHEITELIKVLFDTLLHLSEKHKTDLLPGYTHMQLACLPHSDSGLVLMPKV